MKTWKYIFYILGIIPYFWIISLLTFFLHSSIKLGYFPETYLPDPKDLDIHNFYSPFIDFFGQIWVLSFLLWIVLVITYIIIKRKNTNWKNIFYSAIGEILAISVVFSDINDWYCD
jgi:H+/gluconate symporter-like permease